MKMCTTNSRTTTYKRESEKERERKKEKERGREKGREEEKMGKRCRRIIDILRGETMKSYKMHN